MCIPISAVKTRFGTNKSHKIGRRSVEQYERRKTKKKEEHQLLYKAAERQKMCSEAIQMLEYRKNGKQEM
jgi:hypothetical protein